MRPARLELGELRLGKVLREGAQLREKERL